MTVITTNIATWGNSEAIRIPKALLAVSGLKPGDRVQLRTVAEGRIEVVRVPRQQAHRHVRPTRHVTFDELFAEYEGGRLDNLGAWPEAEMTPAEREPWSD